MAVRIRMKQMGRRHRPFYRVCAMDARTPRDGKVLEELGTYDPMIADTDARAVLRGERIDYWLSVGAQPSDKVKVLIKKYGTEGTRLAEQHAALEKLAQPRAVPAPTKVPVAKKEEPATEEATAEAPAEEAATEAPAEEAATEAPAEVAAAETPAEEAPAAEVTEEKEATE